MRIIRSAFGVAAIGLAVMLYLACSLGTSTAGDQTTANVVANEMVYGTENDELASSTAVTNAVINPNPTTETGTAVFSGLVSGTATVTHNVTWYETDTSGIPYNRTFTFYGTRSVAFSDYSNVVGRTIESGTVTVTIAQTPADTFVSSTPGANPNPPVGSTVTHTVTNVNKTIQGTVTALRNGNTYTVVVNLEVDVISRVTNWTMGSSGILIDPSVQSRDVTVSGTVQVNGTTFTINTTITTAAPQ